MSEKSDKHGFRLDDQLVRETRDLVRGGGPTRSGRGHEPEPVETDTGRDPTAVRPTRETGTPPGMTAADVEHRSAYAKLLAGARYPSTPGRLAAHAENEGAPDLTVRALAALPDRAYTDLPDVLHAFGYGHETERF